MTDLVQKKLAEGCVCDDLQVCGLRLLQHPDLYKFTTDPVILANFCHVNKLTKAVDIGAGSGIIGVLLVGKYGAQRCDCIELQPAVAELCQANVELNGLSERMQVYHLPAQDAHKALGAGKYDLVVSNPPYTAVGDGERNLSDTLALSRHEIALTLDELVASAAKLVRYGGHFCFVHQAERISDICCTLAKYGFQPKRLRFVSGRVGLAPTLLLVEAKRGGKIGTKILRELVLYDEQGKETPELAAIYARKD